jgi:hypothetical protein
VEVRKQLDSVRTENTTLKQAVDDLKKQPTSKSLATVTTGPNPAITIITGSKSQGTSTTARVPAAVPDTIASNSHTTSVIPDAITTTPITATANLDPAPRRTVTTEEPAAASDPSTSGVSIHPSASSVSLLYDFLPPFDT